MTRNKLASHSNPLAAVRAALVSKGAGFINHVSVLQMQITPCQMREARLLLGGPEGSVRGRGGNFVCDAVLRWPSDRLAKVELRDFNLTLRGPDDQRQSTLGRAVGQSR